MKKLILSAIIIDAAVLAACTKEDKIEIPTLLTNSIWSGVTIPDAFEQIVVKFTDSENAVLSVVKRDSETPQTISETEYSYTYNAPHITLTPKALENPTFEGEMVILDKDYFYIVLISIDNDINIRLSQMLDKDQTIWQ